MTIMESAAEMNTSYIDCSNSIDRIGLFAEASYKEYKINLKEVALKVLKENGTEDDFNFLATEATKDYIKRAKKAIEKFIEAIVKFIRKCKDEFIKLVTQERTRVAVEKAEAVCKANPKLRSQKIEYHDTDKQVSILKQDLDRVRKKVSKVKAKGVASENDIEEMNELEKELDKKVLAAAAITSVSLMTAIGLFKSINSRSEVDRAISEDVSDMDIKVDETTAQTSETASYFVKSTGIMGKIKKEIIAKVIEKSTTLFNGIKNAINNVRGVSPSENIAVESEAKLEDLKMFAYVVEAAKAEDEKEEKDESKANVSEGLDLDEYFEELCDDLFTAKEDKSEDKPEEKEEEKAPETETDKEEKVEEDDAKSTEEVKAESAETSDVSENSEDMAQTYMEQLEAELFGETEEVIRESSEEDVEESKEVDAQTYMEQLEAELFGDDEEVIDESSEEVVEESANITAESLLDEMEKLL